MFFANGHISSNTPDPIRTRKSSGERLGQYWGGVPPGKPLGCCWLFARKWLSFAMNHTYFAGQKKLRVRELNPGLARDRREY